MALAIWKAKLLPYRLIGNKIREEIVCPFCLAVNIKNIFILQKKLSYKLRPKVKFPKALVNKAVYVLYA